MSQFFHPADYIVFSSVLLLSAAVGIICALKDKFLKKRDDTESYLMGGRKMSLLPVAISLLVSLSSSCCILLVTHMLVVHEYVYEFNCLFQVSFNSGIVLIGGEVIISICRCFCELIGYNFSSG